MDHRERALKALNHEQTDRVPIDMGGIQQTSIHIKPYTGLVELLGLGDEAGDLSSFDADAHRAMADPSEAVLQAIGIDFRGIGLGQPDRNPRRWIDKDHYADEWGVIWTRSMGSYFIANKGPFEEEEPSIQDLERYAWPVPDDPGRVRGLREKTLKLRNETGCAIVLNLPYCILREHHRIRGFAEAMVDLMLNQNLSHAIMEKALEVSAGIAEAALKEVGDIVDVVCIPEDMGTQQQLFMRPDMYRDLIKPYHRRMIETVKRNTPAKVAFHSDGAISDIIGDFIDIGIEVLNPVQVSAAGMGDTRKLKRDYGRHLTFWGAVDTQHVLPFGTPADVTAEVRRRIDDLAHDGGYVLASVHTINSEVPSQNVEAMLEAARSYSPR
ncbi:MAG: hypothetical protein JW852_00965 [Spirochaetales bacterium]|nr:hypothetical protein [Spirochaetales bacterium]